MLLIIPSYNEEESLPKLLPEVLGVYPKDQVLVVDDGSKDSTSQIAQKFGVCTLRHYVNQGIGVTVQTGLLFALQNGYTHAVQIDGDGQHPIDQVETLVKKMEEKKSNLVIGSRFIGASGFKSTLARRLGIRVISRAIGLLFGQTITDPTSGMRLMDIRAIELFAREYPIEFPEPISVGVALDLGLKVDECSVIMRERQGGESSIFGFKTITYMLRVLGYLLLAKLGRHI